MIMHTTSRYWPSVLVAAVLLTTSACTPVSSRIPGYLTTPKGQLLRNDAGQCWRTVEWRPALARIECDPEIVIRERALAEAAPDEPTDGKPEDATDNDAKKDEITGPTGRVYEGLAGFDFVPTPSEDKALTIASQREVREADGSYRTEIIYAPLSLSSDTSFRFGDDHLTTEGQDAIIELAGTLKRRRAGNISIDVIGHTDRIGTAASNMALSRRRAEAVKAMLVHEGIPPASIRTAGMGASRPITPAGECPDRLAKCELIECLRPDRRVEIRVSAQVDSGKRTTVPVTPPAAAPSPAVDKQGWQPAENPDGSAHMAYRTPAKAIMCRI